MSMFKKALSSFLAVVIFITSLTIGFHGLAAGLSEQELYDDLAALMMNDFVAKRSNYHVENERDMTEEGWNEESNLFTSTVTVTADDNKDGSIYHAARKFFDIFEHEVSYDYGVGNFNKQTVQNTIASKLKLRMSEEEYAQYNIDAILDYFLASANVVNAGSWFYEYIFQSKTTINSALMDVDSVDAFTDDWIDIYECKIIYSFKREWDEKTATKARYSYADAEIESRQTGESDRIHALREAAYFFRNDNSIIWNQAPFAKMTDAQLTAWRNSATGIQFMTNYETLTQYSTEVIYHLFGERIGDIMHLHGNTQPISQLPEREEVRKNPNGDSVPYTVTPERINNMAYNLDGLLKKNELSSVMPLLLDQIFGDEYTGNIGSITNFNVLLQELIKDKLYSDEIINLILGKLFPLIAGELYTLSFDIPVLGHLDLGNSTILRDSLNRSSCYLLPGLFADNVLTGDYATKYADVKAELTRAHNASPDIKESWDYVNWDNMVWGVNDRASFEEAFSVALGSLGRFLRAVLCGGEGGSDNQNRVSLTLTGVSTAAYIWGRDTYANLIIPLFEALGVPQSSIKSHNQVKVLNARGMAESIIHPLLDWVEDVLLENPIETVCSILPNLVLYLDKDTLYSPYRLMTEGGDTNFSLNFKITGSGGGVTFYTLKLGDLLPGNITSALTGLNSILGEFVKLKVKEPVVDAEGNPVMVEDPETGEFHQEIIEHKASLPLLMEMKLRDCGIQESYNSVSTFLPGGGKRVRVVDPGNVILYLFRFLLSSLMQRSYDGTTNTFAPISLIDAFGVDLDKNLVEGVTIGSLITNVVFNYDEAICTLVELFSRNETGYEYDHRKTPTSKEFTYKIKEVDYYNEIFLGRESNKYGPAVKYSENWTKLKATQVERGLDQLLDDVFKMIKVEDAENINQLLGDLIKENLFTNDMLSNLADKLYGDEGFLSNINELIADKAPIDLKSLLGDVLGIELDPHAMGEMLAKRLFGNGGHSEVSGKLVNAPHTNEWSSEFFYAINTEGEKLARDWGYESEVINKNLGGLYSESEIFAINISALLSPLAFVLRFLFTGEHLEILDLISFAGYPGYQYSLIHLYEMLGVDRQDLATYKEYFEAAYDEDLGTLNTVEYIISPLLKFVDKVVENPLDEIFKLIPNLFFAFSTGTINDIINNLLHPVYVLVDILKPILDVYPILDNLLAGIDVGGVPLNISIPLNLDLNVLLNTIVEGVLPEALTFEIEDTELTLHLPYLDTATFCTGTLYAYDSASESETVKLRSSRADTLTVLLRYVISTLFLPENRNSVKNFLVTWQGLDEIDDKTLTDLFDALAGMAEDANFEDLILKIFHTLFTQILPITGELGDRFQRVDFSLIDFFQAIGQDSFTGMLEQLLGATDTPNPILSGFGKIIELLKEFFNKIALFFQSLFG